MERADHKTRFESEGKGAAADESKSVGIRFPLDVIEALKQVPEGRQEYIRRVVKEALQRDQYLESE